jgi:hypothetical protein
MAASSSSSSKGNKSILLLCRLTVTSFGIIELQAEPAAYSFCDWKYFTILI